MNAAPAVTSEVVVAPLPTGDGGAIVDGTYHLKKITYYLPEAPATPIKETWQQTVHVGSGEVHLVSKRGANEERATVHFITDGKKLKIEQLCPEAGTSGPFAFTSTGTELRLIVEKDERVFLLERVQ